jgi:hypothetical protein
LLHCLCIEKVYSAGHRVTATSGASLCINKKLKAIKKKINKWYLNATLAALDNFKTSEGSRVLILFPSGADPGF